MEFFHGTSTKRLDDIRKKGLIEPYLTSSKKLAEYYAGCCCDDDNGEPVVLKVTITNENLLRHDHNAMDEPVDVNGDNLEELRQEAWDKAAKEHPEWHNKETDTISIPKTEWKISLEAVLSVWYEGTIKKFVEL